MFIRTCGDHGLLVEVDGLDDVLALQAALYADLPPGVTEIVPAARTVLVRIQPETTDITALAAAIRGLRPSRRRHGDAGEVRIPVQYDGADLVDVARHTGMTEHEIVEAHTRASWTVAFCGFAPGFGYLVGDDPRLHVPRRSESRTRVPAGAVALAGEFTGVYPRQSPGGWQLIGSTDVAVWDLERDPPGLLRPGVRVRFVAV
ncbi:5-oxoprolinase subunit B family protein [Marinitenerispora sediminis]|uniref:Allophanate hydrolase n=1 Tax=Marinitenerispora sediminis TaxID=1931232 RepID=A0A368T9V3_9ACTN|nr:allophanate hydrolase subunit 1 [Marinitenerispora sediminis]RCV54589.1 allophanate hydrolase [Marinitenerispora sediminis]RCV59856.1 allophanate hydrolase [Marinitenerispora sediminis]RCV61183.1 allophanate hydrolase [Marinitenerispora sediminis]